MDARRLAGPARRRPAGDCGDHLGHVPREPGTVPAMSYHDEAALPFSPSPRSRLRASRNSDDPGASVACMAVTVFALLGPGFLFSGLSHLIGGYS